MFTTIAISVLWSMPPCSHSQRANAMNDPTHELTPRVQEEICAFVRTGSYPHVAAEAAGVPLKVFLRWMSWGKARRPVALYRQFVEALAQAQAIARLAAECRTFERAPLSWLRSGPGREVGKTPGWTN